MILKKISLTDFRNFSHISFSFHSSLTIIIGENARGKTNLLESVLFSVYGTGYRESKEEELIRWETARSLVESYWEEKAHEYFFQVTVELKSGKTSKKFYVDKTTKSHVLYLNFQSAAVLFAPEHIDIVTGSPDKRRVYFDKIISAYDGEYKKRLHNFEHAIRRRNKVLEYHFDLTKLEEELAFWNEYIEEQSRYITKKRGEYVEYLNKFPAVDHKQFRIIYVKNEFTRERLKEYFDDERKWRRTLIGPQKDDFGIYLKEKVEENVQHFGSRSEQRLALFWLKLNEIRFFEEKLKKKPILLLDDIFSELDVHNKKLILSLIGEYQTIATTTESELLEYSSENKSVIKI
ncbi:MAG: DNA replication and repair protein RecF [bacterium]|nr:DNA replication and repair protein RecF [bacterium]